MHRISIAMSGGPNPAEIIDLVVLAERLGYESAWWTCSDDTGSSACSVLLRYLAHQQHEKMGFFAHPPKRVYSSLRALGMGKVIMTRNAYNALYPHDLDIYLSLGLHRRE